MLKWQPRRKPSMMLSDQPQGSDVHPRAQLPKGLCWGRAGPVGSLGHAHAGCLLLANYQLQRGRGISGHFIATTSLQALNEMRQDDLGATLTLRLRGGKGNLSKLWAGFVLCPPRLINQVVPPRTRAGERLPGHRRRSMQPFRERTALLPLCQVSREAPDPRGPCWGEPWSDR